MISVVVPIYNVSAYLCRCLESVYRYDVDIEKEVILVNDGSTDDSLSVCERYKQEFPKITSIINKANGGLSDARNAGTSAAKGDWIYFLDSDDRLVPGALRKLYDFAVENDCEMVEGGFYYDYGEYLLYDDRWLKDTKSFVLSREKAMAALIQQQYLKNFAWGKLYKTEIVKKHAFREGVLFEDSYWQHLIIDECNRVGVVSEPLYFYFQRSNSISGLFSERNLDLLKGNEERLLFIMNKYPELVSDMATYIWRLSHQFEQVARLKGENDLIILFHSYCNEIELKYKTLFDNALYDDFEYRHRNDMTLLSVYYLFRRLWSHFFGKKLKRIVVNA